MNCDVNILFNILILIIIIIIFVVVGVDDNAESGVYTVGHFGENKGHGIPK